VSKQEKIGIFVIHSEYEPWNQIHANGQVGTWIRDGLIDKYIISGFKMPESIARFEYKFFQLKWKNKLLAITNLIITFGILAPFKNYLPKVSEFTKVAENHFVIKIKMPDLASLGVYKSLSILKFALDNDFDYIVITNTSSYINIEKLQECIFALPKEKVLAGKIVEIVTDPFLSGSFRIYTKDVISRIIANKSRLQFHLPEDVAIGRVTSSFDIGMLRIPSIELRSIQEVESLDDETLQKSVHYRCKVGPLDRRLDARIMNALHVKLKKEFQL
jgi:hypothetical protein